MATLINREVAILDRVVLRSHPSAGPAFPEYLNIWHLQASSNVENGKLDAVEQQPAQLMEVK